VIVQNSDDYNWLARECEGSKSEIILIKGSGVDSKAFHPIPDLNKPKSVALVARIITTKGIDDFVGAAKIIWGFLKSTIDSCSSEIQI
jgi:glycosyltransferase involved in cell wall biosynthesis